jgi:hypothetical protein
MNFMDYNIRISNLCLSVIRDLKPRKAGLEILTYESLNLE